MSNYIVEIEVNADDFFVHPSSIIDIISDRQTKSVEQKIFDLQEKSKESWLQHNEKAEKLTIKKGEFNEKYTGYIADLKKVSDDLNEAKNVEDKKEKIIDTLEKRHERVSNLAVKQIAAIEEVEWKLISNLNDTELKSEAIQEEIVFLKEKVGEQDFDLSKGAMTHCEKWLIDSKMGKRLSVSTIAMQKGNEVEDESIEVLHKFIYTDEFICEKNEETACDETKIGTCDLNLTKIIVDVKNLFTHEQLQNVLFKDEIPDKVYWWQVVGYCILYKKEMGEVAYILMNMPEKLLRKLAAQKLRYNYNEEEYCKFAELYTYDNIPQYLKIKRFSVEFTQEDIDRIDYKVGECRKYIAYLLQRLKRHKSNNCL